ncbi:MAG: hypothetical protein AWT59_2779 [Candidatus Gallionella acididurans]|uniref:Uncharacterized protein n=1 Tax=Candidatus Gallionella acididurans TaxID=1796491 RepID=A0A139BQ47_9PROT|nr:MAG: hypothetical protein AWT59_2779 [Candidatus Gallionella acididurans]
MPNDRSKNLKQKLRQMAGIAYERELTIASEGLLQEFQRWENKEIKVFELNDQIHEFHHGISRELYNRYLGNEMTIFFGVESALRRGILSSKEVGEDVFLSIDGNTSALSSHD